jgi:hypothetical protein
MGAPGRSEGFEARADPPPLPADPSTERAPAWERVEEGRYRPLRTRGSFPGRELG